MDEVVVEKAPEIEVEKKEIARININFDFIDSWRKHIPGAPDERNDLPVCSCISFYEACGIMHAVKNYIKDTGQQIAPVENFACNFYTMQKIRRIIKENWEHYSLNIKEDNTVFWKTTKYPKNTKHYACKLSAKVRNSINMDFINYCPSIDDDLEDNVIVFNVFEPKDVDKE